MFDRENFSNLLTKINNEYTSMSEFAKQASLDRSYISKYINNKLNNPPTPKILSGIANASKGLTTYAELLNICGYLPFELDVSSSLDAKLAEAIYSNNLHLLAKFKLTPNDISKLKDILVIRNESNSPIEIQLKHYAEYYPSNTKKLYSILIEINDKIIDALTNLHKNGYLYPIPVYKNTKNIDLFLVSDIVDYINFSIPNNQPADDFFALLVDTDKMLPLLDIDDIAIIRKESDFVNGQIVAGYSNTKESCIIGKLFKYDNIVEFSYLNSKTEKFIDKDIKFLGKVVKAEVKSAFK